MTKVRIDLQKVSKEKHHRPHKREVDRWFLQLLEQLSKLKELPGEAKLLEEYSLTLRIVDEEEGLRLNNRFRGINRASNVLSFPFESPVAESDDYLGDLVMSGVVIEREAREHRMQVKDYWAKMFIHGCLHLFGYTHETDEDHQRMEAVSEAVMQDILEPRAA